MGGIEAYIALYSSVAVGGGGGGVDVCTAARGRAHLGQLVL